MEVSDLQQVRLLGLNPAFLGQGLTLGTVAVAAGIVGDMRMPTMVALLYMSPQGGGAAVLDGPNHLPLFYGQWMRLCVGISVLVEDVLELRHALRSSYHRWRANDPAGCAPLRWYGPDASRLWSSGCWHARAVP